MSDKKYRILHIDDEATFHRKMRFSFEDNFELIPVRDHHDLQQKIKEKIKIDLVLLDLVLDNDRPDDYTGIALIEDIKKNWDSVSIIAITKEPKATEAALLAGANYFLYKSNFEFGEWKAQFLEAIKEGQQREKFANANKYLNPEKNPFIGHSRKMELIRKTLKGLAEDPDATILITGETGVGKGVAASFFHANSIRSKKPFEDIYIPNIPPDLVPSELFGAKKGAFTGATEDSIGRLAEANGGIVFLDEIGELTPMAQTQLLEFLQHKTVRQIGPNTKKVKLDVQILTATNKNLEDEIANGKFREDLYYRINDFIIDIPPLRERREDVLPLILHFSGKTEKQLWSTIDQDILDFLLDRCIWKGNIRQLGKAVSVMFKNMSILKIDKITAECLPKELLNEFNEQLRSRIASIHQTSSGGPAPKAFASLDEEIAYKKLEEIEKALVQKNGKKKDVARVLNYRSDDNLRYAVEKYLKDFPAHIENFPAIQDSYYRLIKKIKL